MVEGTFRNDHDFRSWVAAADFSPGQVVQAPDNLCGVIQGLDANNLKTGRTVTARVRGQVELASASGTTFAAGDLVHWNDTTNLAQTTTAGDWIAGRAAKAKVSGETVVLVALNDPGLSS